MSVQIAGEKIEKASQEGVDAFLSVFIDAYLNVTENKLDASTMTRLSGWQHCLLSYHYFREEVMQGGFIQLIQNGYGSYIFKNPFAKSLKIIGAEELSKIVYKAKEIYDKHQTDLERETTDEEFHAMYEQYEVFADLEERFFEIEDECTSIIAYYVDEHIGDFAEVLS
ncbi:MAG: DMP19 family protein [Bacteroidales bacterium]|nr:DMP19 family protein [Bacteroidales bacterium]